MEKSALIRKTSTLRRVIAQEHSTLCSIYALDKTDHHKKAQSNQSEYEKAQSSSPGSPKILEKSALIRKTSTLRRVIAQKLRTPSRTSALDRKDHQFYLGQATNRTNSKGRYTFYLRMLMKFRKEAHHANNLKKERK